ncbi:MAG TPA: tripartite tricarboxylate transporter substrate binding protein [Burkholderiales bacterium]|nr:tripartite tricarboxylate transporter substrate binding protein [Burkholderiales bacterium]
MVAFTAVLALVGPARAQYPAKPIRLIVPFAAGSTNDIVARIVATPMSESLGRQIVIDNRAGAAGNIGAELAANVPPDGYTMMLGSIANAVSMTLYAKPGYDLVKDFAPVAWIASGTFVATVHPSVPAKSVKELIVFAKARPGQVNVATSGAGIYLMSELFQSMAGIKMTNLTYRSTPYALTALVAGEASVGFPGMSAVAPHLKSGRLRALGVTTVKRSHLAPDIPPIAEAGVPGYEASGWYGLMVPAGTSAEIISRLHDEAIKALNRPDVKERFAATDLEPVGGTAEQFGAQVRSEVVKWGKVIKAIGMQPQ